LGAANLILGKGNEAARNFLDAAPLRSDDELAVTNEVLAYHLLLQDQTTREKAQAAAIRFPNATRIRSLLIQSAKQETPYADLLADTPENMRSDAEVASALARRAMMAGLIETGIEHAKAAVADKPKWGQAHLLLAQAHFARVVMAERTIKPLKAEEKKRQLESAGIAADAAIANAESDDLAYVRAQAFALKSDIANVQGRKEDAAQFARDSFAADASELQSQMAIAQAAFSRNDVDEGILILEQAKLQSKSMPNVCFMLGQALIGRGKDEDITRAFTVFSTANIANIKQELVDPLTLGAIRALVRASRFQEVADYLDRPEVKGSPTLVASIQAYSALKQSQEALCSQKLDEALVSRRLEDSSTTTDFLARILLEAARLNDALPLLQELFQAQTPNFDVGLLFTCAGRLKKDEVILETCQELYDRGVRDWEFQEFESQYLDWRIARNISLSATGFYERFANENVTQSAGAGLLSYTFNAPSSAHRGLVAGIDWHPLPSLVSGLRFRAAYQLDDQVYRTYSETLSAGSGASAVSTTFVRDGNRIPGVVPNNLSARIIYDKPSSRSGNFGFYLESNYRSAFWLDNANLLFAPSSTVLNFDLHYDPAPGHGLWSRTHFYFDLQNLANRTFVGSASNITDTLANVGGVGVENPGYGSSTALAQTATGSIYAGAPRLSIGGFRIKF
jgi:hypothetical protein